MEKAKFLFYIGTIVSLFSFGQNTTQIAKDGINSTVSIVALDKSSQPLGYGSGFIIDDELIATNVHVIEGSNSAYVLKNGEQKTYTVIGYVAIDKANDLIILKVSGLYGSNLTLSSSTLPEIGEKIYAVGNPKGLNGTFSEGIVSGIREIQPNQVIQLTAPISPGSSGGPVLNSSGQVVGIAFASFNTGQNLNFAIPVKYLNALKAKIGVVQTISNVKAQPKSITANKIEPNIKEGVTVRNVVMGSSCISEFSIKNNLPYTVSSIRILFILYDKSGTVIDYAEDVYCEKSNYEDGIKPYMAKSYDFFSGTPRFGTSLGVSVKARVLDFQIAEVK